MEIVQEGSMRFDVLEAPDCGSTVLVGRFGADEAPRPSVTHFALPETRWFEEVRMRFDVLEPP